MAVPGPRVRGGYCYGKGGSMHIAGLGIGRLGANTIVADSTAVPLSSRPDEFLLSQSLFPSYLRHMTKLLEQAIEAVRRLPADSQDDIARTILHLAGSEAEAEPLDAAHLAAVLEGLAQAKRGEFATDDEVEAAFRRFDR
jgi:predicted transcriptional regulator